MEQNLPRCVRQAWDSVDGWLAPFMPLPWFLEEEATSWSLPLYPQLGHLSWDRQAERELHSTPCGLLVADCWRHGPRAQSTSRREAELPDPNPTPETEEPDSPPAAEAGAQTPREEPDSPPGMGAAALTPTEEPDSPPGVKAEALTPTEEPDSPPGVEAAALTPTEEPDSPPGVEAAAQTPTEEPDSPPGVEAAAQTPTEEPDSPPGMGAAAQTPMEEPDSPPGVEAAAQTPTDHCPEDSLPRLPGSRDRQLEPENSEEPALPPDIPELLAAALPDSGRQDQGCLCCLWSPRVLRRPLRPPWMISD
ncbi:hypothetical protein HJG60_009970 [Phyllostomus discolor]|uniref:Uncharacterized protein n=1 Tax=Phyllostomus discolor TaxID=89673 RepID=A0A834ET95_9CHIR|nr:hypothetical protein HJG60_009970 [Phyllostomus discolor]